MVLRVTRGGAELRGRHCDAATHVRSPRRARNEVGHFPDNPARCEIGPAQEEVSGWAGLTSVTSRRSGQTLFHTAIVGPVGRGDVEDPRDQKRTGCQVEAGGGSRVVTAPSRARGTQRRRIVTTRWHGRQGLVAVRRLSRLLQCVEAQRVFELGRAETSEKTEWNGQTQDRGRCRPTNAFLSKHLTHWPNIIAARGSPRESGS